MLIIFFLYINKNIELQSKNHTEKAKLIVNPQRYIFSCKYIHKKAKPWVYILLNVLKCEEKKNKYTFY